MKNKHTEKFILKNKDIISDDTWYDIFQDKSFSESFLEKIINDINSTYIGNTQNISIEFIMKNINRFDLGGCIQCRYDNCEKWYDGTDNFQDVEYNIRLVLGTSPDFPGILENVQYVGLLGNKHFSIEMKNKIIAIYKAYGDLL